VNTATHSEPDVIHAHIANTNNYLQSMQKNQTNYVIFWKKKKKKFRTENFMSKVLHI